MTVGVVDLGPVGAQIVRRLLAAGHHCVVYDRSPRTVAELAAEKAHGAASLRDLVNEVDAPRVILLTGSGEDVDAALSELLPHLQGGDVVVDCAEAYRIDDVRRATVLAGAGIHYVDVGIGTASVNPDERFSLTVGGEEPIVRALDPVLRELTPRRRPRSTVGVQAAAAGEGYIHCGPGGAGHFVRMIHSGIEHCLLELTARMLSRDNANAAQISSRLITALRDACGGLPELHR
jgi:6-phosphogluconate dehydrogenase